MTTSASVGQKLWNYCNILRDAGLSYGDYLEQLTYLIFLKMMDERSRPPYTLLPDYQPPPIPEGYGWPSLMARDGDESGDPLPPHTRNPGPPDRHARRHFPQGPEQNPGAGHAHPAGPGAHQQRELAVAERRREGRRL